MNEDNKFVKKAFFDHLVRQGFTDEHLEVYHEYFDFFVSLFGAAKVMDLDPEAIYRVAMIGVEKLEGDEVIDAYLQLVEFFMEYWSERWENMQPDEGE